MKTIRKRIILASSSPRRRELLQQVGVPFKVIKPEIPELRRRGERPSQYVRRLSQEKAVAIYSKLKDRSVIVLAADTTVVVEGFVLEKPKNLNHAFRMLRKLSGRWHDVFTGVTAMSAERRVSFVVRTRVRMKDLNGDQIRRYLRKGESMDKAGAYAIQGFGLGIVKQIKGSYTNVVGLPVVELLSVLEREFGFQSF